MASERTIDCNVKIAELYEEILSSFYIDQSLDNKSMRDVILNGQMMSKETHSKETSLDARSKVIIAYTIAKVFGCEFSSEVHRTALLKLGLNDTAIMEITGVVKDQKEIIHISKLLQTKVKDCNRKD